MLSIINPNKDKGEFVRRSVKLSQLTRTAINTLWGVLTQKRVGLEKWRSYNYRREEEKTEGDN